MQTFNRLDITQQFREAQIQSQGKYLEHGQRDRFASALHIRYERSIDSKVDRHLELGEVPFPAKHAEFDSESAAYMQGKIIVGGFTRKFARYSALGGTRLMLILGDVRHSLAPKSKIAYTIEPSIQPISQNVVLSNSEVKMKGRARLGGFAG